MITSTTIATCKKYPNVNVKYTSWDDILVEISQNAKKLSGENDTAIKPIVIFATLCNAKTDDEYGEVEINRIDTDRSDIEDDFRPIGFHIKISLKTPIYFRTEKKYMRDCEFVGKLALQEICEYLYEIVSELNDHHSSFYFVFDTKENGSVLNPDTVNDIFMAIFKHHTDFFKRESVHYMTLFQDNPYLTMDEPEIFRGILDGDEKKKDKRKKKKKHKKD